jgi:hypothetical protein
VVLPTGDTVTVQPGGATAFIPAEGREDIAFFTPRAADGSGDAIVVPSDMAEPIAEGEDVSQLLRDGFTDASEAFESELDPSPYEGLVPVSEAARDARDDPSAEQTQQLTATIKDRAAGGRRRGDDVRSVLRRRGDLDGGRARPRREHRDGHPRPPR